MTKSRSIEWTRNVLKACHMIEDPDFLESALVSLAQGQIGTAQTYMKAAMRSPEENAGRPSKQISPGVRKVFASDVP